MTRALPLAALLLACGSTERGAPSRRNYVDAEAGTAHPGGPRVLSHADLLAMTAWQQRELVRADRFLEERIFWKAFNVGHRTPAAPVVIKKAKRGRR